MLSMVYTLIVEGDNSNRVKEGGQNETHTRGMESTRCRRLCT